MVGRRTNFRDISRFTCYPNPGIRQGTKRLHRGLLMLLDTPSQHLRRRFSVKIIVKVLIYQVLNVPTDV